MADDIELPPRKAEAAGGTGTHHDSSRHPFQTQGEASSSSLPQKPPESYMPYGISPPHPPPAPSGWGFQQPPPQQVDFRAIPSIPPDIRSRTLFGLRNGEPRPPLLIVAIILRPVLLISSMAFMAMVIVLNKTFGLLYWGWLAAGIASLLASLTAISIPLLAYKRRRAVSIVHAVLDAVAIAFFAVSAVPGLYLVSDTSEYFYLHDHWWDSTSGNLAHSCHLLSLVLMAAHVVSILIVFVTCFYSPDRQGWSWSRQQETILMPPNSGPTQLPLRRSRRYA